ncbi:PAS domain-containing sensor histidine kinase [Paraburkholderia sp. BCC1885]|uniref:PAS domain-containing sensor histidine kinase n=1 Tax=Paraburkholderia sp. BCC1885 TaxID=2562669 RepID=UPI001182060E|nr:PAS domain-containing sensor histidine kinase [Paraburkholderia sp. BCC1885]
MTPPERLPTDESFRLLVDAVNDYAIFMLDPSGRVMTWNAGAQKMKGYEAEEIIGQHISTFHTPTDLAASEPDAALTFAAANGRAENEGWRRRKDGSTFWANVVISAIRDEAGALRGFAKVTQDLTERKRLAELENISRLTANIQVAREEEQARIAHELHDDLGQQLTALKMALAELQTDFHAGETGSARIPAHVEDMNRLIDATVVSLRRIATGLRPIALETLGFAAALEWLIDDFAQRYAIDVEASIQMAHLTLSEGAEAALFHMVQESLTNVARHAQADKVTIEFGRRGETCVLCIADNGRGAARTALSKQTSFGLLGMGERVRRLNGTLSIDTTPGSGFRIAISIPPGARPSS